MAPPPAGAGTRPVGGGSSPILDAAALHRISSGFTPFQSRGSSIEFLRAVRRPEGATSAGPRRRNDRCAACRRSPAAQGRLRRRKTPRRGEGQVRPDGCTIDPETFGGWTHGALGRRYGARRRPRPPQATPRARPCPAPRRRRARPVPDTRMAGTLVRAPARGPGSDRAEPVTAAPRRLLRDPGLRASGVRRRGEPGSHPDVRAPSQPGDRLRPDGQAIRPLPNGDPELPLPRSGWRVWPSSSSC